MSKEVSTEHGRGVRFEKLDGLRGLAALGVVYFHYFRVFPELFEAGSHDFWGAGLGFYGIQLFFVISGFVILMTLERATKASHFVIARMGRLYPTYWVAVLLAGGVLALGALAGVDGQPTPITLQELAANLTMVQRFANIPDLDAAYWSLSYELCFYLWALLLLATKQLRRVEVIAFAYLFVRVALALAEHLNVMQLGRRLDTLFMVEWGHLFVMGMFFYRMRTQGRSTFRHAAVLVAWLSHGLAWHLESFLAVTLVVGVFYALDYGRLQWLSARPLVWLGGISYPLYVTHQAAGWALMQMLRRWGVPYFATAVLTTLCAFGVAFVVHRLIEEPSARWLKKQLKASKERGTLVPQGYPIFGWVRGAIRSRQV